MGTSPTGGPGGAKGMPSHPALGPGAPRARPANVGAAAVIVVVLIGVLAVPRALPRLFAASATRADLRPEQLHAPPRPPDLGQWRFIAKVDGRPVGYDPCRVIHYQVRVGVGPLNGLHLVQEAVRRLSEATGLSFAFDGMTDEVPHVAAFQDAGKPVWIGWAGETETDLWLREGDVVGLGGSAEVVNGNGRRVYVSGYVVLRPDPGLPPTFGVGETEGTVLLHELGHLVGLDHVDDQNEVMHGGVTHFSGESYGPGDRRGLWELGAHQGCQ